MTSLNQIRRITLINSESMELRNVTDTEVIYTINAPKLFYLVLIHDLLDADINETRIINLFKTKYRNLADANYDNIQLKFLESDKEYDLYFDGTTSKAIPRSTGHTFGYEGDLFVYIPTYEITEGW